jgi:cytochrome c oxidase subunit 3
VMTGLHGLHVFIGVGLVSGLLVLTVRGTIHPQDFIKLENGGLYWHLVDIIWIYLFPLFYLIT